jgi:hypothetical protein
MTWGATEPHSETRSRTREKPRDMLDQMDLSKRIYKEAHLRIQEAKRRLNARALTIRKPAQAEGR